MLFILLNEVEFSPVNQVINGVICYLFIAFLITLGQQYISGISSCDNTDIARVS